MTRNAETFISTLSGMGTVDQCFSTDGPRPSGGPQRSVRGPPKLSHFVSNYYSIHNYYKFYKMPNFLAIQASIIDKISQFQFHKKHERD